MASILRIKRSELSGNPAVLGAGELAYSALPNNGSNGGDRLYIGTGTETAGNAVNHVVIGGKFFTDMVTAATNLNTANTLVKRNNDGVAYLNIIGNVSGDINGNTSGTHTGNVIGDTSGTHTGNVVGDTSGTHTGAVVGNSATASKWLTARTVAFATVGQNISDATGSFSIDGSINSTTQLTLRDVNATASAIGTPYGSTTEIPVLTVNSKGLVTGVTTANVATTLSITGSSGSVGTVNLLDQTLTIAAATGVTTTFNDATNTLTIGLSGSASFTDLTLTGTLAANAITSATTITATGNLEGFDLQVNGSAIIEGNLTVKGVTTTVNSTTVTIADKNLQLAPAANSDVLADSGGLLVGVNNSGTGFIAPSLVYTQSNNRWNFNKDLNVANVYGALKGNADTATKWATARTIQFSTGDVSGTFNTDGNENVTGIPLTLATVNVGAGANGTEYGSSTSVPVFTVNSKGLVTASSSSAIPLATISVKGLASFDSTQFSVTSGAVSIYQVDGGAY
jgi:hypothetical protein